ncbi:MAG: Rrf2 family transcriptional regulator [Candidatus Omnitrophica bacterium]|nr:Rrf2 family transcriptional regulator [Candidatus Omnitrophota bacterium]
MKLIKRDTDYAIRALCFAVKDGRDIIPVSELVNNLKIPRPFLRKILQVLNKRGVLKSFRGKGGGFRLVVDPQEILLTDIMKIFQGPLNLNECFFKKDICPNKKTCSLKKRLDKIEKYVLYELDSITLASLLK